MLELTDKDREDMGYIDVNMLPDGSQAAVMKFMFDWAIVSEFDDWGCYKDRWCFHSFQDAKMALDNWDGQGEPEGWYRHPASNRYNDTTKH